MEILNPKKRLMSLERTHLIDPILERHKDGEYNYVYFGVLNSNEGPLNIFHFNEKITSVVAANHYIRFTDFKVLNELLDFNITTHSLFYRDIGIYLLDFSAYMLEFINNYQEYVKSKKYTSRPIYDGGKDLSLYLALLNISQVYYMVHRAIEITESDEYDPGVSSLHVDTKVGIDRARRTFKLKDIDEKYDIIMKKYSDMILGYANRIKAIRYTRPVGNSTCMNTDEYRGLGEIKTLKSKLRDIIHHMGDLIVDEIILEDPELANGDNDRHITKIIDIIQRDFQAAEALLIKRTR